MNCIEQKEGHSQAVTISNHTLVHNNLYNPGLIAMRRPHSRMIHIHKYVCFALCAVCGCGLIKWHQRYHRMRGWVLVHTNAYVWTHTNILCITMTVWTSNHENTFDGVNWRYNFHFWLQRTTTTQCGQSHKTEWRSIWCKCFR